MEKRSRILTAAIVALILNLMIATPAAAKKKKAPKKVAVIAGTVFQYVGFSLPGAMVTVTPMLEDGSEVDKKAIQSAPADRRGEFAFRVPAGAMRYNVRAEADGWQPAEKTVAVEWDQRYELSFRLKPVPKGSAK